MKIYSMTATFGKLSHQTLVLKPGLNIIEAPNEWGKSTWCAFLIAMLYGIDTSTRSKKDFLAEKERYQPWSGEPMSGRMDLNWNGRDITIERRTKGRSIFGQFSAYETATGITVPELTADNCGQILLGVEQNVFTRAGFLRLKDLPVQQDETLRRRLNALVTTGDESDSADTLAQKLKDLKNRCRFNRTGLIPQAESQKRELTEKLGQIASLQQQEELFCSRQEMLKQKKQQLENHRQHLQYEAARDYAGKLENTKSQLNLAVNHAEKLAAACQRLPEEGALQQKLTRLQKLKEQKEALQMELQMQPGAPVVPETDHRFQGIAPELAPKQAQKDKETYERFLSEVKKPNHLLWVLGLVVTVLGVLVALSVQMIVGIVVAAAGLICMVLGLVMRSNRLNKNNNLQTQAQLIAQRYYPLDVSEWVKEAEKYAANQHNYQMALAQFRQGISGLEARLQQLQQEQDELTNGNSITAFEQQILQQQAMRRNYADALRERSRLEELLSTMEAAGQQIQKPKEPDTLALSLPETERQLSDVQLAIRDTENRLARNKGVMESLGSQEKLRQQLQQVEDRISQLEKVYAAAELAQATLLEAKLELQRRFAPRIAKKAQELFARMTHGRYDRLSLQEDLSVLAAAEGEDTLHNVLWRSEGTADQLYLALRLAVAEELTPEAPLVLDDALVRFDDARLATALQILTEAAETKQVILFTCQSREGRM